MKLRKSETLLRRGASEAPLSEPASIADEDTVADEAEDEDAAPNRSIN